MTSLTVVSIHWLSHEAAEAVLTLQSKEFSFLAFSHPFAGSEGDAIERLFAFGVSNMRTTCDDGEAVMNRPNSFHCTVRAVVVSVAPPILTLCGALVELDAPLPGDVGPGVRVEFVCERLDV